MKTARIGPRRPPRPPARLTPPRTIAATPWRVYGPGVGVPIPVLIVRVRPPAAAKSPVIAYAAIFVRGTSTPLRNAARRSLPTAYSDNPRRERRRGIHTIPTATISSTSAFGRKSTPRGPMISSRSHAADPPPGVPRTSSAAPAHTNSIARVTTMSGTREKTTRAPLSAPMRQTHEQDGDDDERRRTRRCC